MVVFPKRSTVLLSLNLTAMGAGTYTSEGVSIPMAANVTPTDGALSDNTILDGLIGDRLRVKTVVVGTYSGTSTLAINVCIN